MFTNTLTLSTTIVVTVFRQREEKFGKGGTKCEHAFTLIIFVIQQQIMISN